MKGKQTQDADAVGFRPMQDKDLEYFKKGNFEEIKNDFLLEGKNVLSGISAFQEKYNKPDMDTVLNEYHDSTVGWYLGFGRINTNKHGMDCKFSEDKDVYLESKVASISSGTWGATFNDTTLEKAEVFKDRKVWLALSVWRSASDLCCICFGQNERIGEFLEDKVRHFMEGGTIRSTQSLTFSSLVFDYGFDIIAIDCSKQELYATLCLQNRKFKAVPMERIIDYSDFDIEKYIS